MSAFVSNVTVALAEETHVMFDETAQQLLVLEAKNHMEPIAFNFRNPIVVSLFCITWTCVAIVFYFRYILYDYLLEQFKLKELTPIDALIFLVAFIDHLSTTLIILYGTIMLITGKSLQYVFGGQWACIALIYIIKFGQGYAFIGGLMISIYRIFLITDCRWTKDHLGRKTLFKIILIVGLVVAVFSVFLESYHDYEHLIRDNCQLIARKSIMILLDEYEQSRGEPSIYMYWTTMKLAVAYSRVCMVVLEIIIYAMFFIHVYKHDNNELLRRLLTPNVTRNRNRTNAISFFGQFCSFVIEFSWIILYVITIPLDNKVGSYKEFIVIRFIVRLLSFTCIPIIEVLTSNSLRNRMYKFSLYDFIFGLK